MNTGMSSYTSSSEIHGARILVVDGNVLGAEITTDVLRNCGAIVVTARNGLEALQLLNETHFDCILMDVQMPVMDGVEATRLIRRNKNVSRYTHPSPDIQHFRGKSRPLPVRWHGRYCWQAVRTKFTVRGALQVGAQ